MEAEVRSQKSRLAAKEEVLHNKPLERSMLPHDTLRVAYQGEPGAYSEQAAIQFFSAGNQETHLHPCISFEEMCEALDQGLVERAVFPSENTYAGPIYKNLDLLLRYDNITIVGELDFPVEHCLLAMKGVQLSDIKVVKSHYMALEQCGDFLKTNGLTQEVAYDTAGSARLIHKTGVMNAAAIASRRAAQIYDLNILAEDIQDKETRKNYTRFLILSKDNAPYVPNVLSKTSLAFTMNNSPGALYRALSVFNASNIDLTRIDSRHLHSAREVLRENSEKFEEESVETRWGYLFYIDIARHAEEKAVGIALDHLREISTFFKVFGSYPSHNDNRLHL